MATRYHIYMGDDNDGPVDYTDPVGDSADPWLDVGPRPAPSATNYGIRAYEQNATRATVIPRGTPPLPVSDLTVTATYRE
jgi:hypothetical protein